MLLISGMQRMQCLLFVDEEIYIYEVPPRLCVNWSVFLLITVCRYVRAGTVLPKQILPMPEWRKLLDHILFTTRKNITKKLICVAKFKNFVWVCFIFPRNLYIHWISSEDLCVYVLDLGLWNLQLKLKPVYRTTYTTVNKFVCYYFFHSCVIAVLLCNNEGSFKSKTLQRRVRQIWSL